MNWLFNFLLFLLPFIVFPIGSNFFEAPKVFVAEMAIELLFLSWIWKTKLNLRLWSKKQLTAIATLFILSLVDLVFLSTSTSLFGNPFRLQGLFLFWHLLILSLISSQTEFKPIKFLPNLALVGLFVTALFMGLDPNQRSIGTLGEPNALAATAIFLWPLSYFYFPLKSKYANFLAPTFALIIVILSNSRSALVALAIQLLLLGFAGLNKNLKVGLVAGMLVFLLALILPFSADPNKFENRFENRGLIWQTSLASGLESPDWGHGFGNVESALNKTSKRLNNNVQYNYVDSSHDIFLDFWVEGGLIGLLAFLSLISFSMANLLRARKTLEITLFLGLLATLSFNPASVVSLVALWWLIGSSFHSSNLP